MFVELTDKNTGKKSLFNINHITEINDRGEYTSIFTSDDRLSNVNESYEDIIKFIKIKNFVTTTIKQ